LRTILDEHWYPANWDLAKEAGVKAVKPFAFNPDFNIADCACPKFKATLSELTGEQEYQLFMQYLGYTLMPSNSFEKALLLKGGPGTGKSTILFTVQRALFSTDEYSTVKLHDFTDYKLAGLDGKRAIIMDDLSREPYNSDLLKTLAGKGEITARHIYGKPFSFSNKAKIMATSNYFPRSDDKSGALEDRWIIIPFNKRVRGTDKEKRYLIDKLQDEAAGIFFESLKYLMTLLYNNKFIIPESCRVASESYEDENDLTLQFLKDCTETAEGEDVTSTELIEASKVWLSNNGMSPNSINRATVGRAVRKLYGIEGSRKRLVGGFGTIYKGIKLI
jgi:putative DNA primase/helicase